MNTCIARVVALIALAVPAQPLFAADGDSLKKADALLSEKKYREAARHYDFALKENARDLRIIVSYGWCLFLDGRYDRAIEVTSKGLAIEPRNPYVLGNLALYHLAGGDSKAGTSYYDRLFDLKLPAVLYCSILKGDIDDNPGALPPARKDVARKEFTGRATSLYPDFMGIYADYLGLIESDAAAKQARDRKDHSAAAAAYGKSITLSEKVYGKKNAETAFRYYMTGISYRSTWKYDDALQTLQKALSIYIALAGEESADATATFRELGYIFYAKKDLDAAIIHYEKSLLPHRKGLVSGDTNIAERYRMLGHVYDSKNNRDSACECFGRSLAIYEKTPDSTVIIRGVLYRNMGESLRAKGDLKNALTHFKKSIALAGESPPDVLNYYNAINLHSIAGMICLQIGDCGGSVAHYDEALRLLTTYKIDDAKWLFVILYEKGQAHWVGGDVDRAIECMEKAREQACRVKGDGGIRDAEARSALAFYQGYKGYYGKALENTLGAMEIFRVIRGETSMSMYNAYINLCVIYWAKNNYRECLKSGEKALSVAAAMNMEDVSMPCGTMANAHSYLGEHAKALAMCDRAVASSRKSWTLQHRITVPKECGYVALAAKDYARALRYFEESVNLIEQYRVNSAGNDLRMLSANTISYYFLFKINAITGDMQAAFHTAERMRARMFLDRLSLSAALNDRGISYEDRARMLSLHDRIKSLSMRLGSGPGSRSGSSEDAPIGGIRTEKEKLEKEFNSLDESLMKHEKYRALRKPRFASLADARALCGPTGAILEYVIYEYRDEREKNFAVGHRYCMVITSKGAEVVTLDPDYDYSGSIMKFRDAIIHDRHAEAGDLSRSLYRALFAPLEKHLAGMTDITIVPDGALAFLPFDALLMPGAGGKPEGGYLCERFSVTLSPSVSVSMAVRARSFPAGRSPFLAFGGCAYSPSGLSRTRGRRSGIFVKTNGKAAPDIGSDYYASLRLVWDDLPGCEDEVREISSGAFGGAVTRVVSGRDASESRVKSLSADGTLSGYRNLHFALHGYYDQENPSRSAIVFSEVSGAAKGPEDGYLSVEEVTSLNLAADMVNLSACETGLGKAVRGDGVVGLTRAFQIAGANRVGVTLWQVDDEATKEFMVTVYRKIEKEKKTYRQAYRETRLEFIRSGKFSSPYFWSPFVLYGE